MSEVKYTEAEIEKYIIDGWGGSIEGDRIKGKTLTVVPILRAGLGMLDGVLDLIPTAKISVVGLQRDVHGTLWSDEVSSFPSSDSDFAKLDSDNRLVNSV